MKASIEEKSRQYSIKDVSIFLAEIKLDQYIQKFEENEITGDVLLSLNLESFEELEVFSALHKLKIIVNFRRHLEQTGVEHPVFNVIQVLAQNKLIKYRRLVEQNGIDGDMLLYEDDKLVRCMFKEVGIGSDLDISKIISKFKTFASRRK